jgi:nucleoside-diphosphate-sugar epimerase
MRILITGNMGYVGSVLVPHLRKRFPMASLVGCDPGWFAHCLTSPCRVPEADLNEQLYRDYRTIGRHTLNDVDAIVHLAAVSNDATGERFAAPTHSINYECSASLAKVANECGVSNFVFASSCSVYGASGGTPRKEDSAPDPLTAYARSKINTERALDEIDGMTRTSLRFATACGPSARLRTDLVLNWMVSDAIIDGKVTVHGDGEQIRPLVDVRDMCTAIEWALLRWQDNHEVVNVGDKNYTINDIARIVSETLDVPIVREERPPDKRSYNVDFDKFKKVAAGFQPAFSLSTTVHDLVEMVEEEALHLGGRKQARLAVLAEHVASGRLDEDLRWRT